MKTCVARPRLGFVATARAEGGPSLAPEGSTCISGGEDKIAVWLLDTGYDGRSLYQRQVFFPMAGPAEGWTRLAKNLNAEIDEESIEAYRGTVSLAFAPGALRRVAVKIVDERGIESLKVLELPE